ncbi:hypothetical protein V2J09_022814 [Rumex salicifolius]
MGLSSLSRFFNLPKTRPIATKGPPSAAYLPLESLLLQEARSEALEEQKIAAHLANTMSNSLKGRPALGRIFQGKEPPQFVALFEPMIVLKGGLSSGSKLAVKALGVEPYTIDGVALIQIPRISTHNSRVVRVDTPGVALKHAKEGTENSTFWAALGGKQNYASKKESQNITRDPHLYSFSINRGKFQVEEIYNFTQDDLLTEDTLILDTHAEVFVWVGHTVDPKEKQKAFEMGEKYIALAASLEGLPQQVPLYKITEIHCTSRFTGRLTPTGTCWERVREKKCRSQRNAVPMPEGYWRRKIIQIKEHTAEKQAKFCLPCLVSGVNFCTTDKMVYKVFMREPATASPIACNV